MNAPDPVSAVAPFTGMTGEQYQESLRRLKPTVYLDGRLVDSVADEPGFGPGIRALGVTYDMALQPELAPLMRATVSSARIRRSP